MSDPSDRGWGDGWPNCPTSQIVTLRRSDGVVLPVHRRIAPLITHLCDETERRGYNLVPGWCWGFACRAIRGSDQPSYHSWGLSVDLNAPTNPMGSVLRTDMPSWMPRLWESFMFRWGGTYRSRPDAMHYEFMGTPADADRLVRQVEAQQAPTQTSPLPIYYRRPYRKDLAVLIVQQLLNGWVRRHRPRGVALLVEDGVYGPASAATVSAFKRWVIGIQRYAGISPTWPNTDTTVGPVTYGGLLFWNGL